MSGQPLKALFDLPSVGDVCAQLERAGQSFLPAPAVPFCIAALAQARRCPGRPLLVVCADDGAARALGGELEAWLGFEAVRILPSRGVSYESHLLPPPHLVGLRIAALRALWGLEEERPATVVVAAGGALCERVPEPALLPPGFVLRQGAALALERCLELLVAAGYERVEQVEERGQFALRGGLLDVYPVTAAHAVRVDFFGDEVEGLRYFSTFTQRTLAEVAEVAIAPAAELAPSERDRLLLAGAQREEGQPGPTVEDLLDLTRFVDPLSLTVDLPVVVAGAEEVEAALAERAEDDLVEGRLGRGLYVSAQELKERLLGPPALRLCANNEEGRFAVAALPLRGRARSVAEAELELERYLRSGYVTVVSFSTRGEGERFAYNLKRLRPRWLEASAGNPQRGLWLVHGGLKEGFVSPQLGLAIAPLRRLIPHLRPGREASPLGPGSRALRALSQLKRGDIVVHEDHGIARFAGFQTRTVAGVTRDYLYLEYAGEDRVWVPTDQLAKITRYLSGQAAGDGRVPGLSKLGSKRWEQLRARVRSATRELAGELLALYAARAQRKGFAFPPDSDWVREFESGFPYTETPDQLAAIEAVKADMEAQRPMDRLICGDVGFGKTEVALRAAVKAVTAGKQVLLLAPTTVLVQQHYGNFLERLADLPVLVDYVSRLRPPAAQRKVLKAFAEGKVDILIGTHRLLSRDLRAKDLGLLVIDEEQRFGVRQKELLRSLKLSVDVISLSATPIPRTLQISLAGLRDISVIETPPEGRRTVHTFVGEYDERLVRFALQREADRGGQSFYLHNRVETIEQAAERVRALAPKLRVALAHGQMEESQLEGAMLGFLRGEADVLVCTSIIESGLDVPRANTLIVEEADRFGLAQLYQIRGRVGRRRERAYAYLLYDSAAALSEQAAKRLAALSDHTELGSGFALAMRDLELRGAGDLLGAEQSGHVAALGFELYLQMLEEAVRALEDREPAERPEPVRLDVKVDAYLPDDYVHSELAKVDLHRRLAQAASLAELEELQAELLDRFGPPPAPVKNLLALARARVVLALVGVRNLSFRGERAVVSPLQLSATAAKRVHRELPEALYEASRSQLTLRCGADGPGRFKALLTLAELLLAVRLEAREQAGGVTAAAAMR